MIVDKNQPLEPRHCQGLLCDSVEWKPSEASDESYQLLCLCACPGCTSAREREREEKK
jgi:hypothetical protein